MSFFVVFPWFIKPFSASLTGSTYAVFIISTLLIFAYHKRIDMKHVIIDRSEIIIVLSLLAVILLRLVPMVLQIAPAGADMSMHSYIARLIYDRDGIPDSYRPLLPIKSFGAYPTGLPALSAIISLTSNMPVFRSALFISCLAHAFITLGLYLLLIRFFEKNTAAATAILAGFLTRSPQWVIRWGGNPTVLAIFFLLIAFSLIIELKEGFSPVKAAYASLALSATLITHMIIFYAGIIFLAVYFAVTFPKYRAINLTVPWISALLMIFLLPFIINYHAGITRSAIDFARAWQDYDIKSVFYDLAAGVPFLLISLSGLVILLGKNAYIARTFLLLAATLLLLIINYKFWLVPFSLLLYPGRVAMLMIIPLSVFSACSVSKMIAVKKKRAITCFAILGSIFYVSFYLYNSCVMSSVTKADIRAFDWIDKTLSRKAVIMNNYGDAGIWIPSIIGRTITNPHGEPIHADELKAGLAKLRPNYIYIGSKAVYPVKIKAEELESEPEKYKRVYSSGGAQVWKIL